MVFAIDPRLFLFPLIQSWPVPSKTSESLLVKKVDSNVVFLNQLRHINNTVLSLVLPVTASRLPAAMAVRGVTGVVEGIDYRNKPVLAAIRPITGTPWYLVAKTDKSEAYAPLYSVAWYAFFISLLLLLLSAISIGMYWRKRISDIQSGEREQLVVTLRSIGDAVISTDTTGCIVLMNAVAEELTGWTLSEAQGLPLDNVFRIVHETFTHSLR